MRRWALAVVATVAIGCSGDDGVGTPSTPADAQAEDFSEASMEASQEAAAESSTPDAGPDGQVEAEAGEDAKPEAAPDVVSDHVDELEAAVPEAEPEAAVEPGPEPQPEPTPEAGPDAPFEAGPEPQPEPQPEAGPEPAPEAGPDAMPDAPEDVLEAAIEAEAGPAPCPSIGGAMVRLPEGFCIDLTEVTVAAYRACVNAALCTAPLSKPADSNWTLTKEDHPLNWVSWSEAKAFCAAHGKRLCGRIGGGSPGANELYTAAVDQWYAACSSGGSNVYTYGDTYQAGACWAGLTHAAGTAPGCHSPDASYSAAMDLSGNLWEWEDLCDATSCVVRGGGNTTTPQTDLRCDFNAWRGKSWAGKEVGFRCCGD